MVCPEPTGTNERGIATVIVRNNIGILHDHVVVAVSLCGVQPIDGNCVIRAAAGAAAAAAAVDVLLDQCPRLGRRGGISYTGGRSGLAVFPGVERFAPRRSAGADWCMVLPHHSVGLSNCED